MERKGVLAVDIEENIGGEARGVGGSGFEAR